MEALTVLNKKLILLYNNLKLLSKKNDLSRIIITHSEQWWSIHYISDKECSEDEVTICLSFQIEDFR